MKFATLLISVLVSGLMAQAQGQGTATLNAPGKFQDICRLILYDAI